MKKIIILRAQGNELANQLWNYASIYAYTLQRGYTLKNSSFFEYGAYFTMPSAPNLLFKTIFFLPFKNYTKRKTVLRRRIWRKIYTWYSNVIIRCHNDSIIQSNDKLGEKYYLPPSTPPTIQLAKLEKSNSNIYFDGWLFRNPVGLEKYHIEIKKYLQPRKDIQGLVNKNIQYLRNTYSTIIGFHIRQGDYATWRGGAYLIPQKRAREIMDEYLKVNNKNSNTICFAITSDGPIDKSLFAGLNIFVSKESAVHDLFFLASTDLIIGSNSTFGAFASYYGNIPLIVMEKGHMDWNYYRDKTKFFENKYSTFVNY